MAQGVLLGLPLGVATAGTMLPAHKLLGVNFVPALAAGGAAPASHRTVSGQQRALPAASPHPCICPHVPQRLLEDFPEKEAQLLLTEAHGRLVLEKSSQEGARGIQEQLRELTESWQALQLLKERLLR